MTRRSVSLAFVACTLLLSCGRKAEAPRDSAPSFASACRQLDQADALATWVGLDTVWRLEETDGRDGGVALIWQADLARALAFEMSTESLELSAAGEQEIANRVSAAGSAVLDLGHTIERLDYTSPDERLASVQTAVAAVDQAIEGAYQTFNTRVAPCAALRPEML